MMGPAPNVLNVELLVAGAPKGEDDGCWLVFPNEPNIEFALAVDLGSPPSPIDMPPNAEDSGAMESSVADVMSTEMEGVDSAGAVGGDNEVDGCCDPNPNEDLPNAEVWPEKALNPNAPPALGPDGADVPNAF